jgi:outer membrane protein assembly complex protein YaeT
MNKRRLKLAAITLTAIVCLPVLAVFLLHTPPGKYFIFQQLRHYLRSHSDIDLNASGFRLNFFSGTVMLEAPAIQSASAPDLPPFFKAASINAELSILDAIRKHWIIENLELDAPQVQYYVDQNGRTNLPKFPTSSGKAADLLINRAEATNSSFKLHDTEHEIFLLLSLSRLSVKGDMLTQNHHFAFTGRQESVFKYKGHSIPINSLGFSGTLQKSSIQVDSAYIAAANSRISITGTIHGYSEPDLELHITPTLDLGSIARAAGLKEKIQGDLSGSAKVGGRLDHIRIEAQLKGSDFSALNYQQTNFDLKTSASWTGNPGKLMVDAFSLSSPQGSLNARAGLFPEPGSGINSVAASFHDLNLSPIWKLLKPPLDLAGRGTGRIALQWRGPFAPSKITGDAHLNLTATRPSPGPSVLPVSGTLDARLQPGRILGNISSVAVFGTQVRGTFSLQSLSEIEGSFQGESTNIEAPLTQVSQFLGKPEASLAGVSMSGPARFEAQISGSLKQPKIIASVDAPSLQIGKLTNLKALTDATIQDSRIVFQNSISLPEGSTVLATGTLEFKGPDTVLNLDARSDQLSLAAIGSAMDSRIPATGNLKTTLHLNGPVNHLAGHASITGDELSVYREPMGQLDLELRLSGSEIQSTKFKLLREPQNPGANSLDAQFIYDLDSGRYQFQADGKDLAFRQLSLPDGSPIQGAIQLAASGEGTIEQPSLDIKLESDNIQVRQKSIGPLSMHASLRSEQLAIEALVPKFSIGSTVHVTNRDPYPFKFKVQATNSDLSRLELKGASGQLLAGSVEAILTGAGNFKDPDRINISAQIQNVNLLAGKLEVHTQDPIKAEYRNNSLELLSPATIVSGNSKLEISGRVPVRQSAPEGTLRFKGQLDLAQASGFVPIQHGFGAAGILNLDFALAGTSQKISSAGMITLDGGTVELREISVPLTDIVIRAEVRDGALTLQRADASWGEGKIALTGEFPFGLLPRNIPVQFPRKEGAAHFTLDLANLKPEISGALPRGVSGLISMNATGQMDRIDLRALIAQIHFPTLGFRIGNIEFGQKKPSSILIRDGIASISHLSMAGGETSIEVGGSAGIFPDGPLDLRLLGNIDAAILTSTSKDLKAAGKIQVQVTVAGSRKAPVLSGLASMNGGRMNLRSPRVVADSLNVLLNFSPNQISVQKFSSTLNGGSMNVQGTIGYRNGTLNDFNLKADLQDFFLNFPEGLKSVSSGDLAISSSEDSILISGNIRTPESSYRESFRIGGQLLSYLKSQQLVEIGREPDSILERIRLNIAIRTSTPLLVQNNVAKVEATANLRLVGSFYEPSMTGRITLNEGGEILMNQQKYYIRQGAITLTNQTYIEPQLNIRATTRVDPYDITLQLTGPPERLITTLSSEPSLAEADILSLLLTGQATSETQNSGVVRTQALSILAGQAGEQLTSEARRALRLSTFRIDPGLIGSESDPGARLTIGEDITKDLSLAYSMNLTNGGDQIWAAQYDITRRLSTQVTQQQGNIYRFEFRHDLRLGGPSGSRTARKPEPPKLKIGSIQIQGGTPFSDKTLLNKFNVEPGDKYDFQKIQKGLDHLINFYTDQKRLEADIRLQRETAQKAIDLKLNIHPGPAVDFSFDGFPLSERVKEKVEKAWTNGAFETERIDDAVMAIRMYLIQAGYLQSEVTCKIEEENALKKVRFHIAPGTQYVRIPVTFPGASEISANELNIALDRVKLQLNPFAEPQRTVDYLELYYKERGYLQARADLPQLNLDPKTGSGRVSILIREGPLFTIGDLEFIGNRAFSYDQIWSMIPTSSGSSYDPNTLRDAAKAIETLYQSKGYNDTTITYRVVQDSKTAHANVAFQITERRQSIIRDIVIEGNRNTSRDFVERQLDFEIGEAHNFAKINESRKRLYASGVYTSVDFQTEEMPASATNSSIKDVRIKVSLREVRPYRLQYGFFYDTDRGPGGLLEAQNLNFMGRASNVGMRVRYDSDLKEGRLFFNQPFIKKIHVKMDASIFAQKETREGFSADRIGFSIIRQKELGRKFRFDYGYRYDYVRWDGFPPDPTIFQASEPVARLTGTITRDTRDSILDATRGEFSSHTLEFGPSWLGSKTGFTRYYGQYFRYVPLDKYLGWPVRDKEKRPIPPKLIYAGALRLGLTAAFQGQDVISPERFFAGGGTTMRGFEQDRLGPLEMAFNGTEYVEVPVGGEALFLFNNEIRFPIWGILQGVGFLDIGNVFEKISDIQFDLRKSAGAGLRLKIKYIPLRFDYGFKLDRRPGESGSAFFFSIGQAF